jgi:hypothetical protein
MTKIEEKYAEIESTKFEMGALAFFSNSHKKTREWQALGSVQRLLRLGGENSPMYAVEKEPPDFAVYDASNHLWSFVELVEVTMPGERRHDFFRRDAMSDAPSHYPVPPPMSDPWKPLRDELDKKANKKYPTPITLIVLYGIGRFAFQNWTTPFNEQLLAENSIRPFSKVTAFDRVLVLNCDHNSLTELYPQPKTIVADDPGLT